MLRIYIILIVGVISSALSVIFIRESTEPPVMLASYRVLLAALILMPLYWRDRKRLGDGSLNEVWHRSWIPGLVLGVHFIFWVVGARMTTAANANLIVSLMPIVMPFLVFVMFQERIQAREAVATAMAIVGMLLLTVEDFSINRTHFNGDILCLIAMILFAYYLALARKNRHVASVWLYIVPVYLIAGVASFIVACFFSSPIHSYEPYNALMIMLLAVVSTVIGHSALNYAMQHLRGQTVTVVNMGQFIVAGVFGYFLYQEVPTTVFYVATSLFLFAMGLIMVNQRNSD